MGDGWLLSAELVCMHATSSQGNGVQARLQGLTLLETLAVAAQQCHLC